MCPSQLDYLSRSFWSLWGKSVPLSHGISSIFDLARVDLEVRRSWPDEINEQIGFFPWSPWKKPIKQQGALEPLLLPSAHWPALWCSSSSWDESVVEITFNWGNSSTSTPNRIMVNVNQHVLKRRTRNFWQFNIIEDTDSHWPGTVWVTSLRLWSRASRQQTVLF